MKAWLVKNKGYLIHGAAVLVVFLSPSVQHFLATHAAYSAIGATVWGYVLHWSEGK